MDFLSRINFEVDNMISEDELRARWAESSILVSIICTTYNHEEYIFDAMKGFISQQTNIPFEIIVNDDASTDLTYSILLTYKNKYPNIIRIIRHEINQYSKGISPFKFAYELTRGKYIAICEGDDFWNCSSKIMIQYQCLENNFNADLCVHRALTLKNGKVTEQLDWNFDRMFCSFKDIFSKNGQFAPTSSYFFRKSLVESSDELKKILFKKGVGDFFLEIFSAKNDKVIVAINEPYSTYRVQSNGSWTESNLKDISNKINNTYEFIEDINNISELFEDKDKVLFNIKIAEELQDCIIVGFRNRQYAISIKLILANFGQLKFLHLLKRIFSKVFL